jgi:hypothetical protein
MRVRAGPPHHRDHQIAGLYARRARPDLDDLHEALVPDDQVRRANGGRAVLERADLAIGTAYADVEHAQARLGVAREGRRRLVGDANALLGREDGDCAHESSWGAPPWIARGAA